MRTLLDKFAQPSSWAGITGMIAVLAPAIPQGMLQNIAIVGAGICGLIAFWMNEDGAQKK